MGPESFLMDLDELGEVDEHGVAVLQRARAAVAMDGNEVVGRQTTVRFLGLSGWHLVPRSEVRHPISEGAYRLPR